MGEEEDKGGRLEERKAEKRVRITGGEKEWNGKRTKTEKKETQRIAEGVKWELERGARNIRGKKREY